MKDLIGLILFVFSWSLLKANDTCKYDKQNIVRTEILSYIDSLEKDDNKFTKNFVYILSFYHNKDDKKDFSFTLGMICNKSNYQDIRASHYIDFGGRIFLLNATDELFLKSIPDLIPRKIDSNIKEKVINRLFDKYYVIYHNKIVLFQLYNCKTHKEYIYESWDIPSHKIIYNIDKKDYPTPIYKGNILTDSIFR